MNTHTLRTGIASGTCVVLGLSLSVAIGIVPRAVTANNSAGPHGLGADVPFRVLLDAAAQQSAGHAAAGTRSISHTAHLKNVASHSKAATKPASQSGTAHSGANAATAQDVSSASTTKQPATPHKTAASHKKSAGHKKTKKPTTTTVGTTTKLAARTTPSDSAVSSAITSLKTYIHTPFSINSSEVNSFGNDVCGAFDAKKTLSEVEAEILAELQKLPYTTVESGAADFVVNTAVKLYCPGYNSRLG